MGIGRSGFEGVMTAKHYECAYELTGILKV